MMSIIDEIEANDIWNETINEMIRRGKAVRRPDGKVIFSDRVPQFDIIEDIAQYTTPEIKSAENSDFWMTFGRVDYNWITDPEDLELTDENFSIIDAHIRDEVRYVIDNDADNSSGESNLSSGDLNLTQEDEDEFTIYYYWGSPFTTGVNSAESFAAESNEDITIRQQAIDTIEARVADYTTHEDVSPYWGGGIANPNKYLYFKLRYAWEKHPEDREGIIQQYIRGIEDGRIDPSNPLPHGEPNQHLPSKWDAESFEAERETCYYCENRGHDSGGLCTECNKSWFGPLRKTILGKHDAESFEAQFKKGSNRNTSLKGADLSGYDLSGANLTGADLEGAELRSANLVNADLAHANLVNANLYFANLRYAYLTGANLRNADLRYADLYGANMENAYMSGVKKAEDLSSFTSKELTESSSIHGDFDHASINYSGHQNLIARAESQSMGCNKCGDKYPVLDYKCNTCSGCSGCCECASAPQMMGLDAEESRREWTFLWKPKNEGWGNSVYATNLKGAKEQILKTYPKGSSFFQRADLSTLSDDPSVNKQRWSNWNSQWNAEENIAIADPGFWMNYPITSMLATAGIVAIGKTLLNSRKGDI